MALFSRIKTWASGEVLFASDLNAEFNNIITNTKPESIEDYSADVATMKLTSDPGGLGTESLATSLAEEIRRIRFVIKRILNEAQWYIAPTTTLSAGGISTASLADLGTTADKLAADSVTTSKILDLNVTGAKIANDTITHGKHIPRTAASTAAAGMIAKSASSGVVANGTAGQVNICSCTLTTTGRPVRVVVGPSGVAGESSRLLINAAGNCYNFIYRDATEIAQELITGDPTANIGVKLTFEIIDYPSAGTYTYTYKTVNVTSNVTVEYAAITAYEIL